MQTIERLPDLVAGPGTSAVVRFVEVFEAVAFWFAVGTPLRYLPSIQLFEVGQVPIEVLAGLLAVNLRAPIVGHRYNRSTQESG